MPEWLDELTAKYGEPRVGFPVPVNLGDRKRRCWVWFPGGKNHNICIDQFADRWQVLAGAPGRSINLQLYDHGREPDDSDIRNVLVTAGMLAPEAADA
jgi:hypothetical protein